MEQRIGAAAPELVQGDITRQDTEAIANAANSSLLGGGGVDGAIHRAGGPAILRECKVIVDRQGRLPPGRAVATTGGELAARRVLHTVGPVWRGGADGEPEVLASCYRSCLELARDEGLRSVAFPSISTGVYGYPVERAATVALTTVLEQLRAWPDAFDIVRFVLFDVATLEAYRDALADLDTVVG